METKIVAQVNLNTNSDTTSKLVRKLEARNISAFYGKFRALTDINIEIYVNQITAVIGPSGCGKSTLWRSFNHMIDLRPNARVESHVPLDAFDINHGNAD